MTALRPAAVAGTFYPADPEELTTHRCCLAAKPPMLKVIAKKEQRVAVRPDIFASNETHPFDFALHRHSKL